MGVGIFWLTATGGAQATLVENGSFEDGLSGWNHTGTLQVVGAALASDGAQAVRFNQGNVAGDGILSQSFATVTGQTYTLEFDYGVLWGGGASQRTQKMRAELIGIGSLLNEIVSDGGTSSFTFETAVFDFTADSALTTLRFTDLTTRKQSINNDFVIDRVSVTTVPLPAAGVLWPSYVFYG
jgi:hypothetical protein